ncbi:MAG: alkaline phosphatase family protein, partial [Candidatus Helarchaeota archaeon]
EAESFITEILTKNFQKLPPKILKVKKCLEEVLLESQISNKDKESIYFLYKFNFFYKYIQNCPENNLKCEICNEKSDIINLWINLDKSNQKHPPFFFLKDYIKKILKFFKQNIKKFWTYDQIYKVLKYQILKNKSNLFISCIIDELEKFNFFMEFKLHELNSKINSIYTLIPEFNLNWDYFSIKLFEKEISYKFNSYNNSIKLFIKFVLNEIEGNNREFDFINKLKKDYDLLKEYFNIIDTIKDENITKLITFYYIFKSSIKNKDLKIITNNISEIFQELKSVYPTQIISMKELINFFENREIPYFTSKMLKSIILVEENKEILKNFSYLINNIVIHYISKLNLKKGQVKSSQDLQNLNLFINEFSNIHTFNESNPFYSIIHDKLNNIIKNYYNYNKLKVIEFIQYIIQLITQTTVSNKNIKDYSLKISKIYYFEEFINDKNKLEEISKNLANINEIIEVIDLFFESESIFNKYNDKFEEFHDIIQKKFKEIYSQISNKLWYIYLNSNISRSIDLKAEISKLFDSGIKYVFFFIIDALSYLQFYQIIYQYNMKFFINKINEKKICPMLAIYPTNTGPCHLSLITGVYPDEHGIIMQKFKNTEKKSEILYSIFRKNLNINERIINRSDLKDNTTTLYEILKRKSPLIEGYLISHVNTIGLGEILHYGMNNPLIKIKDISNLFDEIENHIIKVAQIQEQGITIIQIPTLDMIYHKFKSLNFQNVINFFIKEEILDKIEKLYNEIRECFPDFINKCKFVITADHGLKTFEKGVSAKDFINLGEYVWVESRNILIWEEDPQKLDEIYKLAKNWDFTKFILLEKEQIEKRIYFKNRSPNMIIVPKENIYLIPFTSSSRSKFAHGGFTIHELIVPKMIF